MELPKCYRCGRAATNTAGEHGYWCSWCGQAFDPKDEEQYRKEEADKQKEKQILHRPTFTCQDCGRVVQPMYRRGDMFLFRGWRCLSCGRMLCDSCHSPTLAQPCKCGSTQFESIDIPGSFAVKAPSTPTVATKIEDYNKWQWFDYLIFAALALVGVLAIRPEVNFFIKLLIWFGCGAVAGIIYHLTLHTLWTHMFPNLYRRWVCSKCHAVVSKEATKCQGCGTQFGEKRVE